MFITGDAINNLSPMVSSEEKRVKAPVLFISHGAPTFAIEPGSLAPGLERLGKRLAEIRAVLVISPHWQTRLPTVARCSRRRYRCG